MVGDGGGIARILASMPTPSERNALLFVGVTAILGVAVRVTHSEVAPAATAIERSALQRQIAAAESARGPRGRGSGRTRTAGQTARGDASGSSPGRTAKAYTVADLPRGPVDMDRARPDEMVVLPHIGDRLARRIAADRDSLGAFGSLEGLRRVRGVGPVVVQDLAPLVTFSGTPRLHDAPVPGSGEPAATGRVRRRRALRYP
ncbi:MAG: hypothetical protein NVS1B4_03770 [Gemmatimonadaceae bacterium]